MPAAPASPPAAAHAAAAPVTAAAAPPAVTAAASAPPAALWRAACFCLHKQSNAQGLGLAKAYIHINELPEVDGATCHSLATFMKRIECGLRGL